MVLAGAEVLFYPTAIGSEPYDATLDTHQQWQRAMQGHAVSNAVPVVAANRIGTEENAGAAQSFYGHSFIADHRGELVQSFGEDGRRRARANLRPGRDRDATAPTGAFSATAAPTFMRRELSKPTRKPNRAGRRTESIRAQHARS